MKCFFFSLPFPLNEDGGDEGGSGSGSAAHPPRPGKGLTREQTQGLEMVRNIITALDEEGGLQEVHTFRSDSSIRVHAKK